MISPLRNAQNKLQNSNFQMLQQYCHQITISKSILQFGGLAWTRD